MRWKIRSAARIIRALILSTMLASSVAAGEVELISRGTVRISGMITQKTLSSFNQLLRQENIQTVELDSGGGLVYPALRIASSIHENGINTWIKPGRRCYSACGLIFLADKVRLADGRLGVHQIRSEAEDNSRTQTIVRNARRTYSDYAAHAGGPVAFVTAWLEQKDDGKAVQLSLF